MLRRTIKSSCTPKVEFARVLRRKMTLPERILWNKLKAKNFFDLKFRRQSPIGPYIADFLCVEKRLIIEIDGSSHDGEEKYDQDLDRQHFLEKEGFTVIRFKNEDILKDLDSALLKLRHVLNCEYC